MKGIIASIILASMATAADGKCLSDPLLYVLQVVSGFDCETEPGVCRGTFDLGAPQSRSDFEALTKRLTACASAAPVRDKGVNHPDFYDAWAFAVEGGEITLSIKDKSALGKTFVVLRGPMSEMRRN